MNILFVTKYADHVLESFLEELATRVSLRVVCDSDETCDRLVGRGVSAMALAPRSRFDRRYRQQLEHLYRAEPWDLIQCFHGNAHLANLIQWNRRHLPLVGYRGRIGHLKFREAPAAYWSVRNPQVTAVVANSTAVKSYLQRFRLLRPKQVQTITTGVNPDWIRERCQPAYRLREQLGLPADAFVVVSMASLRPVKRFDLTVRAAKTLAPLGIRFVHLGDARDWPNKTRDVANLQYLPYEPNPFPILAAADLFVSTSDKEAFSRASLEAMACGKPVLGPRAGGAVDLIDDGVNGRWFAPGDADDLAGHIRRYFENRAEIETHGRQARLSVEQRFSTQRMVASYLDLYRGLSGSSAAA